MKTFKSSSCGISGRWAPWGVDLVAAWLAVPPEIPYIATGQATTLTLTATARDGGNTDAQDISAQFWAGIASHPIGDVQRPSVSAARSLAGAPVEWQAVPAGVHSIGVTLDGDNRYTKSDEENNQLTRTVLVAGHRSFLPLSFRGR